MDILWKLADAGPVAKFQRLCGVEIVTCDQQTQTKGQTYSVDDQEDSNNLLNGSTVGLLPNSNHQKADDGDDDVCSSNATHGATDLRHRKQNGDIKECNNNDKTSSSSNSSSNGTVLHHCDSDGTTCNGVSSKSMMGKNGHVNSNNNFNDAMSNDDSASNNPTPAYTIKYKSLLYLAHFGAFLGNEECYLTFFPFCVWNIDSLIVRQVGLLWGIVMYMGQATKEILCWPRPRCPPVVRLEFSHLQEFSMPSTHAMAGTAIPFYMAYLVVDRYQVPVPIAMGVASFWFATTNFSRLYLGVHSILDLIVGSLFAVVLYATFIRYIEDYDLYQQTHRFAPVMVLVTAFVLCTVFYPSKHRITTKGDTVQIVAGVAGFSVGFWLHYQLGYSHLPTVLKPYTIPYPTIQWVLLCLLRFGSGSAVLGVCYLVIRKFSIRFFSYLYGLEVPDKNNTNVMTGYKFVTYFSLGIIIAFFIPLMHVWMGIPRLSLFEEVV